MIRELIGIATVARMTDSTSITEGMAIVFETRPMEYDFLLPDRQAWPLSETVAKVFCSPGAWRYMTAESAYLSFSVQATWEDGRPAVWSFPRFFPTAPYEGVFMAHEGHVWKTQLT